MSNKEYTIEDILEVDDFTLENSSLRIIKTARSMDDINEAVDQGFTPIIKEVKPSEKIYVTDVLIRDKKTGHFEVMQYNYYAVIYGTADDREIIGKTTYYPYQFPKPYAAYIIPDDLEKDDRVILDDVIEDVIGEINSHSTYRLQRAEAVWDGENFKIDYLKHFPDISVG